MSPIFSSTEGRDARSRSQGRSHSVPMATKALLVSFSTHGSSQQFLPHLLGTAHPQGLARLPIPFPQPNPSITQPFWLLQSPGLLTWVTSWLLSSFPSSSLLSWSCLVSQPCSVWTFLSACFLSYIHSKKSSPYLKGSLAFLLLFHSWGSL